MNIIRNYKSNLLISIIIISSLSMIGIAIIMNSNREKYSYQMFYGNIYFEYAVSSCGNYNTNDAFKIIVSPLEKQVIFNQNLSSYCAPPISDINYFRIELILLNNDLTLREIFDPKGHVSTCICSFGITGKISNLMPGSYNLIFIWDNRFINQPEILKVFEISI